MDWQRLARKSDLGGAVPAGCSGTGDGLRPHTMQPAEDGRLADVLSPWGCLGTASRFWSEKGEHS